MATKKQAEASRANGKKSSGPITAEGKRRAALNSLSHGLTSRTVILTCEDPEQYAALHRAYFLRFQPVDEIESGVVDKMVLAHWYQWRAGSAETALVDYTMDDQEEEIEKKFDRVDNGVVLALALKELYDDSTSLANVQRHAERIQRDFHRALNELRTLRADPLLKPPADPGYEAMLKSLPVPSGTEPAPATVPQGPQNEKLQNEPGDPQPLGLQ